MDEKKELIQKINELDKKFERNKLRRSLITIALYAVANVVIAYLICDGQDISLDMQILLDIVLLR